MPVTFGMVWFLKILGTCLTTIVFMSPKVDQIIRTKTFFIIHDFQYYRKMCSQKLVNYNIGVLGHVDCGKTSLVKALSTTASTACFDKNPESRERGITLDLGFSSFTLPLPAHLANLDYDKLQVSENCLNARLLSTIRLCVLFLITGDAGRLSWPRFPD